MGFLIHEFSSLCFILKAPKGPTVGAKISGHALHVLKTVLYREVIKIVFFYIWIFKIWILIYNNMTYKSKKIVCFVAFCPGMPDYYQKMPRIGAPNDSRHNHYSTVFNTWDF